METIFNNFDLVDAVNNYLNDTAQEGDDLIKHVSHYGIQFELYFHDKSEDCYYYFLSLSENSEGLIPEIILQNQKRSLLEFLDKNSMKHHVGLIIPHKEKYTQLLLEEPCNERLHIYSVDKEGTVKVTHYKNIHTNTVDSIDKNSIQRKVS